MKKLYMALIVVIVAFACLRVAADSFADTAAVVRVVQPVDVNAPTTAQ